MTETASPPAAAGLPKALWLGTAAFAVVSALLVAGLMGMKKSSMESEATKTFEKEAISVKESELAAAGAASAAESRALPAPEEGSADEPAEAAATALQAGVAHFQKGELPQARAAWLECLAADPENADCRAHLKRLDRPRKASGTRRPGKARKR